MDNAPIDVRRPLGMMSAAAAALRQGAATHRTEAVQALEAARAEAKEILDDAEKVHEAQRARAQTVVDDAQRRDQQAQANITQELAEAQFIDETVSDLAKRHGLPLQFGPASTTQPDGSVQA